MSMVKILGYTYPVRDKLRELGAKWDPDEKAWFIEEEKLEEANAIVGKTPPREPKKTGKPARKLFHVRCPTCGTEWDIDLNKQPNN